MRRRSCCAPLQRCALPRIVCRLLPLEAAVDQVVDEDELCCAGNKSCDGDELVDGDEGSQIVVCKGLIAAHVARNAEIVEGHKDAIRADETQNEMVFA